MSLAPEHMLLHSSLGNMSFVGDECLCHGLVQIIYHNVRKVFVVFVLHSLQVEILEEAGINSVEEDSQFLKE